MAAIGKLWDRELGVGSPGKVATALFSRERVRQMDLINKSVTHNGCINTLSWSKDGRYLVSGSDDRHIKVWDAFNPTTDRLPLAQSIRTGHRSNIFCAELCPSDQNLILSCAADGEIRKNNATASSRGSSSSLLRESDGIIHMFCFATDNPSVVYTAEDEGVVARIDLRAGGSEVVFQNGATVKAVRQHEVLGGTQLFLGGAGFSVKQLDLRTSTVVQLYGPHFPISGQNTVATAVDMTLLPGEDAASQQDSVSISGLDIGKNGRCLLASYQGDQIYTFPISSAAGGIGASGIYGGHRNYATFLKQVCFFGPRDEYICSGSDSGHAWLWKTSAGSLTDGTEHDTEVVNLLKADSITCNGIAAHPTLPLLATYGIDHSAKLWGTGAASCQVNEEGSPLRKAVKRAPFSADLDRLPEVLEDSMVRVLGRAHLGLRRCQQVFDIKRFQKSVYSEFKAIAPASSPSSPYTNPQPLAPNPSHLTPPKAYGAAAGPCLLTPRTQMKDQITRATCRSTSLTTRRKN